jgi:hypothetical protein
MTCCTYIDNFHHTTDAEICELLAEAQAVDPRICVEEFTMVVPRLFRRPIERKHFSVMYHIGGIEYQIINVFGSNSRDAALMYLLGLITGHKKASARAEGMMRIN